MIERILVPTDASETARKAARYAYDLASLSGGTVTLLHVIDLGSIVGRPSVLPEETPSHILEPLEDYLRRAAEIDMRELEDIGTQAGVETNMVIRYGHPAEEIVAEAERSAADLIVMGSHGRSALAAALLGSVTLAVVHRDTAVPVLIIRRG
jgi:universal stress protein A